MNPQDYELHRIEKSTKTIEEGMTSKVNWGLIIVGILCIPITGGLSVILLAFAITRSTNSGEAIVQAAMPTTMDLVYPKSGCTRIIAAIGSGILTVLLWLLVIAIVASFL